MPQQDQTFIDATKFLALQNVSVFSEWDKDNIPRIQSLAKTLPGKGIFHISASRLKQEEMTGKKFIGGGGLAEMLKVQIPLERSMGINSRLFLPSSTPEFYSICSSVYELIIGERTEPLSLMEQGIFENVHIAFSSQLQSQIKLHEPEIVVIHDFEFISFVDSLPDNIIKIIYWHVDFPSPNSYIGGVIRKYLDKYDVLVVSDASIACNCGEIHKNLTISPPFINPCSVKNNFTGNKKFKEKMAAFGINFTHPIISQIGRFSSQKNPLGAYRVFDGIKNNFPHAQLLLAGLFNIPGNDYDKTKRELEIISAKNPNVHVFNSLTDISPLTNDEFIGGVYSHSDVVLNMGTHEAFGLTITEAMWHKRPVIAMQSPGSRAQIVDKTNGFLAEKIDNAIDVTIGILSNQIDTTDIVRQAHNSVKDKYLVTHYLLKMLSVYKEYLERRF